MSIKNLRLSEKGLIIAALILPIVAWILPFAGILNIKIKLYQLSDGVGISSFITLIALLAIGLALLQKKWKRWLHIVTLLPALILILMFKLALENPTFSTETTDPKIGVYFLGLAAVILFISSILGLIKK